MLKKKWFTIALVFSLLLFISPLNRAAETKPEAKPKDNRSKIFAQIAEGASTVRSLSSDFIQERILSMLKEPLISTGKFAFEKPDLLYWEVLKPSPLRFVIRGDKARRWSGDSKVPEVLEIEQEPMIKAIVEQVFGWARADFNWLEKRYRITVSPESPQALKLVPLSFQEKKFLSYIAIVFSEDWTHVRSVELHEKSGDLTRLRFMNTLLNPALPKDFFEK